MKAFQFTTQTADESAALLTRLLQARIPYFFTKYGDGFLECVHRIGGGRTRDWEFYTEELRADLLRTFDKLLAMTGAGEVNLMLADWLSARFNAQETGRYERLYRDRVAPVIKSAVFVNYETVLLDRKTPALLEFYKALRADPRRKVIMAPAEWSGAVRMLEAHYHIVTPMKNLYEGLDRLREALERESPDILLYASGMAGTIPVIEQLERRPDATYINLGSALDPLYRGRTRMDQIDPQQAKNFLRSLSR